MVKTRVLAPEKPRQSAVSLRLLFLENIIIGYLDLPSGWKSAWRLAPEALETQLLVRKIVFIFNFSLLDSCQHFKNFYLIFGIWESPDFSLKPKNLSRDIPDRLTEVLNKV